MVAAVVLRADAAAVAERRADLAKAAMASMRVRGRGFGLFLFYFKF